MELKCKNNIQQERADTAFNRTAYGIEMIPHRRLWFTRETPFNRTAYGIEICVGHI